jgi:hypothetical protein
MIADELSPLQLMAVASEVLVSGRYFRVTEHEQWNTASARLFEDVYSIVGVAVFESCDDLLDKWPELQGSIVDTLSKHVSRADPKAWDGYLVLLTPSVAPSRAEALEQLRYNTNRVRKLVATGDELKSVADVHLVLSSLLPLIIADEDLEMRTALDLLPNLLAEQGIDAGVTQLLIEAFTNQEPLIERLHERKLKP